jgi:hypothetical protein
MEGDPRSESTSGSGEWLEVHLASVAFRRGGEFLRTPATKHSDGDGE